MSKQPEEMITQTSSFKWSLHELIILYLVWFFLTGFYEMTKQLVFEGSIFITQVVHYSFFFSVRLLFIPILLYLFIFRKSIAGKEIGLTLHRFWRMLMVGFKASFPFLPLIILLVHLPLVNTIPMLQPMLEITTPEDLAISLVYFICLFFMTLIPAFSEELLFRGLTFPFLEERFGFWKAILINTLLYGIFYMPFNLYLLALRLVLGFFTTYLFWRTKNLIPSTIFQAFFHATFILYLFGWGWW